MSIHWIYIQDISNKGIQSQYTLYYTYYIHDICYIIYYILYIMYDQYMIGTESAVPFQLKLYKCFLDDFINTKNKEQSGELIKNYRVDIQKSTIKLEWNHKNS